MKHSGQIVVFPFPLVSLQAGKLRPALVLQRLPGDYDDWLIVMISSQLHQYIVGFDEIIREEDEDFKDSGLKTSSIIRSGRLAVISSEIVLGVIGVISSQRLQRIRERIVNWLSPRKESS